MERIYLDNAATTGILPEVKLAILESMDTLYANPSSIHADGRKVRSALEHARKSIAKHLGASIGEIFFTSGGTESSNMILNHAVKDLGVKRIITTKIEHPCVLHTVTNLENSGIKTIWLSISENGVISTDELEKVLTESKEKTLVVLMHANNEIGTILPLQKVAEICSNHDALFFTDTVQTIGFYPINLTQTPISFLSGSAHKFHGPKGVGFVYINSSNIISPFIVGGEQERNMRAGTENIHSIIGMAKALDIAITNMKQNRIHILNLKKLLIHSLTENFENLYVIGNDNPEEFHYKILNIGFPETSRSELLVLNLDIEGVSASGGSACSSGVERGSHVLEGIKAPEERKYARFSFSRFNTKEEIDYLITKLKKLTPVKNEVDV
jgi:cysteine desulfurase